MGTGQGKSESGNSDYFKRTIEGRILNRAILDLFSPNEETRIEAIEFFAEENHYDMVKKLRINPHEVKRMVFSAIRHEGIRREKMARDIIRYLARS